MGTRLQKSLFLLAMLSIATVAGAAGTTVPECRTAAQGYSRLLERPLAAPPARQSLLLDCLMEEARLRHEVAGPIPGSRFEALRGFCREATRVDGAALDEAAFDASRQLAWQRYRSAGQEAIQAAGPDYGESDASGNGDGSGT